MLCFIKIHSSVIDTCAYVVVFVPRVCVMLCVVSCVRSLCHVKHLFESDKSHFTARLLTQIMQSEPANWFARLGDYYGDIENLPT